MWVHLASDFQASKDRAAGFDIDVNARAMCSECWLFQAGRVKHANRHQAPAPAYGLLRLTTPNGSTNTGRHSRQCPNFAYSDLQTARSKKLCGAATASSTPELKSTASFRPGQTGQRHAATRLTGPVYAPRILGSTGKRLRPQFCIYRDEDVIGAMKWAARRQKRLSIYIYAGDGATDHGIIAKTAEQAAADPAGVAGQSRPASRPMARPNPHQPVAVNFLRYRPVLSNRRSRKNSVTPEQNLGGKPSSICRVNPSSAKTTAKRQGWEASSQASTDA